MYGKYPKIKNEKGQWVEQKAWPMTDFNGDPGLTVQSDRDEADINKIIQRIQKTGQIPPMIGKEPFYGDVSEFGDLQENIIKIQKADELFMTFPADVREKFENDKVKMIEFLADENNREEALKLGLIQKRPDPEPEAPAAPPAAVTPV